MRGVVQIVHGVSEHMERYSRAAEFLNGRGFLVCGGDHLGHGRTARPGEYGFFAARNGWELVVRDVRTGTCCWSSAGSWTTTGPGAPSGSWRGRAVRMRLM